MGDSISKELVDKALESVELAKSTGKIKKGTNEVTKAIERGNAKLVVVANDVNPPEIVMHLPLLSKEKGVLCVTAGSKEELGAAAGLEVGTVSVAVIEPGEAKQGIKELATELDEGADSAAEKPQEESKEESKEEAKEETEEEAKEESEGDAAEEKKEEAVEEKKEESAETDEAEKTEEKKE